MQYSARTGGGLCRDKFTRVVRKSVVTAQWPVRAKIDLQEGLQSSPNSSKVVSDFVQNSFASQPNQASVQYLMFRAVHGKLLYRPSTRSIRMAHSHLVHHLPPSLAPSQFCKF